MHPYFATPFQPWQFQPWQMFNPSDITMAQRTFPWFDPIAYQAMFSPPTFRGAYPAFEPNPYYAGILPRPMFHAPASISPEIAQGVSPVGFAGFGASGYLSPENFISSFGKVSGNYLSPEFLEFLRAE